MKVTIQDALSKFDVMIGDGQTRGYMNNPAKIEDIDAFEERHGVKLPPSYKIFLLFCNGGMMYDDSLHDMYVKDKDLDALKWNTNYLLSLEELEEHYNDMASWNFGIPAQNISCYPFIPFCHTETGERLVFINSSVPGEESCVLDAYHEETPETWGVVAKNFTEFLIDYCATFGKPKVLGDLEDGSALDLLEPLLEESEKDMEDESPQQIIDKTTNHLKINPKDDWSYVERGMAYKDLGKPAEALEDFNIGISIKGDKAYYYFCRGELYLQNSKFRPALIDFDTAVKLEPDDVLYIACRAQVLWEMNKIDKALDDVNRAIQINPKHILSHMIRESIYRSLGQDEKADADAKRIADLKEDDAS